MVSGGSKLPTDEVLHHELESGNLYIGKIIKKHPPLCEAQRVQKSVNLETKKVAWLQNCSRGPDHFLESNFKFQMFSNDILDEKIVPTAVTEKTVTNLNLNFKFLFNVKFGSWAFRNCAYFVMKPSGCDIVRLCV